MRKLISTALCLVILLAAFSPVLATDNTVTISNLEEFLSFAENCRLDSYSIGKTFRLTANIDLSDADFDGIPVFCGTFEGDNHTISGLSITSAGSAKGLFRYVLSGATVRNLKVEGALAPTGSREQVGGIAGSNAGTIENCSFSGRVSAASHVGGVVGVNLAGGLVDGCTADGSISAHHFGGGICGSNDGSIRDCENRAAVNITARENDIDISDITLGSLTSTESATATTDIGGIAGFSSGAIIGCTNKGAVGYPHMGYNVGGIVGLHSGYIADCKNYGIVSGRKEVGGIAGQQEPEVLIRYDADTLQILKGQFAVLSQRLDQTASNSNANTATIRNLIYKIENHIADAENALEYLKSGLTDPKWGDLKSYAEALQTIRDSITGIDTSVRSLWGAVDETMTDLNSDLKAVMEQLAVIQGTLNNADANLGGAVFDNSDQDTAEDFTSKISNCVNFAPISGDMNAGGIVGAIVFENDLDPEADISVVGDATLNAVGSLRSVILGCTNSGAVTVKNQYAGGMVGYMSMGLIKDCIQTGALENGGADYVGGIAGHAGGYIRNCKTKSTICGDRFVGGIAGSGTIVTDCYAMVSLSGSENTGAILGQALEPYSEADDPITGNYYLQLGRDMGAIDGICYADKAQGISQADFLAAQADCPIFSKTTVTFLAEGEVVQSVSLSAGSDLDTIPDVPAKPGYDARWEGLADANLTNILFDLTFTAAYDAHVTTVESDLTDENGRPILLLQGNFSGAGEIVLTKLNIFAALEKNQTFLCGWELEAEHAVRVDAGRLLLPDDFDAATTKLYVRGENGKWTEHPYTMDGSYLVFAMSAGDAALSLVQVPADSIFTTEVLIAAGSGAALVLLIVGICIAVKKSKTKNAE